MKIETKLDIGDIAYIVRYGNEVEEHPVDHIVIFSDGIVYKCGYGYSNSYYEDRGNLFDNRKDAEDEAIRRATESIKEKTK